MKTTMAIRMPGNRLVIRTFWRSVLLTAAVVSFPLLRSAIGDPSLSTSPAIGDYFYLPLLLVDLRHRGILRQGDNSAFLGNPGPWLHFLARSAFESISGSRVEALQEIADAGEHRVLSRRLLAVPESKKEALNRLEDALLEPPGRLGRKRRRRPRYLPELTGDSLESYRRRVFVEVAPAGSGGSAAAWFERHYPRGEREFEIIRVEAAEPSAAAAEEWEEAGGMAEWLERNVREEDYVVVKAEAEVMEEVVRKGNAIGLVDELFLECKNEWEEKGKTGSRRAYWECLALYGRIRDQGVAVHQWWGSS